MQVLNAVNISRGLACATVLAMPLGEPLSIYAPSVLKIATAGDAKASRDILKRHVRFQLKLGLVNLVAGAGRLHLVAALATGGALYWAQRSPSKSKAGRVRLWAPVSGLLVAAGMVGWDSAVLASRFGRVAFALGGLGGTVLSVGAFAVFMRVLLKKRAG